MAYVSQQAWVQQGTLRDNVCFGRAYDETRFSKVVYACALERDLDQLPGRDMTELGGKVCVIVTPLSTVEFMTVASDVEWLCLTGLQRHPYPGCSRLAGCVHSSVNKPGANGRVSYDSLTHSRLYCRDREKK